MKGKEPKTGFCSAATPTLLGLKEATGLTGSDWAQPALNNSAGLLSRAGLYGVYITDTGSV